MKKICYTVIQLFRYYFYNMKIIIDPNHKIVYSSFYIKGLIDVFGEKNISFSSKYFHALKGKDESHSFDHYFAFIIFDNQRNILKKVVIDFRDKSSIKRSPYDWCDLYAKINYSSATTPDEFKTKIIAIPPSFGIHIYGFRKSIYYAITNLFKSFSRLSTSPSLFLANYKGQYKRPCIDRYKPQEAEDRRVFFISTLWENENGAAKVNAARATFIRECKKNPNIDFEGGLCALSSAPQADLYKDIVINQRYTSNEYIKKTKQSLFVFNTPALHDCHGWKLGEFLSMGKAIISYPIINDLPAPLVHGEHIHIVNNENELKSAIQILVEDKDYRSTLEKGARAYYEAYCSPDKVIKTMLPVSPF